MRRTNKEHKGECKYNPGVGCANHSRCNVCGWNKPVQDKRKVAMKRNETSPCEKCNMITKSVCKAKGGSCKSYQKWIVEVAG